MIGVVSSSHVLTAEAETVDPDARRGLLVTEGDRVVGVISTSDIVQAVATGKL